MSENNYIMLNLEDEKSGKIAEIMANKSCKKILSILAEEELSETDISKKTSLPLNTAEYNLKKLVEAGLVEKAKTHFWSVKGKKIPVYKLSNKYIVIAPKNSNRVLKTFLPVVLLSGIGALVLRFFTLNSFNQSLAESTDLVKSAPGVAASQTTSVYNSGIINQLLNLPAWEWFLIGAGFAIILFLILTKLGSRPHSLIR